LRISGGISKVPIGPFCIVVSSACVGRRLCGGRSPAAAILEYETHFT
jgi:hypothetical protein